MSAAAPTPLATAIKDLRESKHLSHDRFAALLREQFGLDKAGRQLLIDWEKKNAVPSAGYRDALVRLGIPEDLWPVGRRATMRELGQLSKAVEDLQRDLSDLSEAVRRLSGPEDRE